MGEGRGGGHQCVHLGQSRLGSQGSYCAFTAVRLTATGSREDHGERNKKDQTPPQSNSASGDGKRWESNILKERKQIPPIIDFPTNNKIKSKKKPVSSANIFFCSLRQTVRNTKKINSSCGIPNVEFILDKRSVFNDRLIRQTFYFVCDYKQLFLNCAPNKSWLSKQVSCVQVESWGKMPPRAVFVLLACLILSGDFCS